MDAMSVKLPSLSSRLINPVALIISAGAAPASAGKLFGRSANGNTPCKHERVGECDAVFSWPRMRQCHSRARLLPGRDLEWRSSTDRSRV
jgi:hypothetical protein